MLPALTPAVSRALDLARRLAKARSAEQAHPIDLLHALLEDEDGRPATLTIQAGLDRSRYQSDRPEPVADVPTTLPLASDSEKHLFAAHDLALEVSGEAVITSEALLLALVRHDRDVAFLLTDLGMGADRLEALLHVERPPTRLDEPLQLADLTERVDIARILDVGFNRSREALRVVEDYCRFGLDDAFLSGLAKQLRHDLTAAVEEQGPLEMLACRETTQDVGTTIGLPSERERASLLDVVGANLGRLLEALRSLEEFAKVSRPLLAERIEQMRYRAYTLERAILLGARARQLLGDARLYVLLSGASCAASLEWTISEAAAGGARIVQLREKNLPDRDLVARAREVRRWTRRAGVLFIVNDRPDVARLVEADGVHLGQDDLSVKDARRILGPEALIGVSTHEIGQVRQAILDGATYIGIGPVFPSGTKSFANLSGLEFVRAASRETTLPAFVIGGIDAGNLEQVVAAGGRRVAVSQAIARAEEPRSMAAELLTLLEGARESDGGPGQRP